MKTEDRIIYYRDELNDDFSGLDITVKPLGAGYQYIRTSRAFRIFEALFYYGVMIPVVYILQKVICHQSFANRKVLKQAGKDGCFIVSNHTQVQSDSYIGPLATFPKKCFIISHPSVTSIPGLRFGMQAYGVIPLGTTLDEKKEFLHCIETRLKEGKAIIVYPEAHVWPYYTKIRSFDDQAFQYLSRQKKPMFVLTNCYKKRRFFKKPRIVTYADGPFYPDPELSAMEAARQLRNIAYETMCERTRAHTDCEYIRYIKAQ